MQKKIKILLICGIILLVSLFLWIFLNYKKIQDNPIKETVKIEPLHALLTGELKNIDKDKIAVEILSSDLESNASKLYENKIDSDIVITRYLDELKSEDEFLKEQKAYNENISSLRNENKDIFGVLSPNWQKSENITFNDLSIGDKVNVAAKVENKAYIAMSIAVKNKQLENLVEGEGDNQNIISEYEGFIKEVDEINNILRFYYFDELKDVAFDKNSEAYLMVKKPSEEFYSEQREYNKAISGGKDPNTVFAPSWFNEKKMNISDIKPGDQIYLYIKKNGNELYLNRIKIFK